MVANVDFESTERSSELRYILSLSKKAEGDMKDSSVMKDVRNITVYRTSVELDLLVKLIL